MKFFVILGTFLLAAFPVLALTVEEDKFDSAATYSVFNASSVVYLDKCARDKFSIYEWKTWEGYYRVRCFIEPVAIVTVKKDAKDPPILEDPTPFVQKALESTVKLGGNLYCNINLKKAPNALGIESMTFRAYRQKFQCGYKELEAYFMDLISRKGAPLTLEDVQTVAQPKIEQEGPK